MSTVIETAPPVVLVGRSGSHFTRVATMVALELGVPFERQIVHDLLSVEPETYSGHPALKIPALRVGDSTLFGTENICRRLVELAGREGDRRVALFEHARTDLLRNAQELVWHAMAVQVQLIVGVRFAKLPTDNVFFEKAHAGLAGSLGWLDTRLDRVLGELPSDRALSLFEIALFSLVEHMRFRTVLSVEPYDRLCEFARVFGARPSAQATPYRLDPR
ncbi:MAG: glutathione S-transferase family protein [Polyangiales bacterium]